MLGIFIYGKIIFVNIVCGYLLINNIDLLFVDFYIVFNYIIYVFKVCIKKVIVFKCYIIGINGIIYIFYILVCYC